jgi:protocatechuate 4,5-dioxygenase alpha subunit
MNPQLEGVEQIPGTYIFDIRQSIKGLRLNRFLWNMRRPHFRELFVKDAEALMAREGLSDDEKDLIRRRDWIGMLRYGSNFFLLEKFVRVSRLSNLEAYAAMRGETLEEFLKTRNVPDAR